MPKKTKTKGARKERQNRALDWCWMCRTGPLGKDRGCGLDCTLCCQSMHCYRAHYSEERYAEALADTLRSEEAETTRVWAGMDGENGNPTEAPF